jgi:dUTP diphosphatase
MNIEVRILDDRLFDWGFPYYGSPLAAGMDLFACLDSEKTLLPLSRPELIPTGIAIHIADPGWCGIVVPRSGQGHHRGLVLGNSIGVVDADYVGECFVSAWNRRAPSEQEGSITIRPGDRIAQLLIVPIARPTWSVVKSFSEGSQRGEGGFGSTNIQNEGRRRF